MVDWNKKSDAELFKALTEENVSLFDEKYSSLILGTIKAAYKRKVLLPYSRLISKVMKLRLTNKEYSLLVPFLEETKLLLPYLEFIPLDALYEIPLDSLTSEGRLLISSRLKKAIIICKDGLVSLISLSGQVIYMLYLAELGLIGNVTLASARGNEFLLGNQESLVLINSTGIALKNFSIREATSTSLALGRRIIAYGCADGAVGYFYSDDGVYTSYKAHGSKVTGVALLESKEKEGIISCGLDKQVVFYHTGNGEILWTTYISYSLYNVSINSEIIFVGGEEGIALLNIEGHVLNEVVTNSPVLTLFPQGNRMAFATGPSNAVEIWDDKGRELFSSYPATNAILSIALVDEGVFYSQGTEVCFNGVKVAEHKEPCLFIFPVR